MRLVKICFRFQGLTRRKQMGWKPVALDTLGTLTEKYAAFHCQPGETLSALQVLFCIISCLCRVISLFTCLFVCLLICYFLMGLPPDPSIEKKAPGQHKIKLLQTVSEATQPQQTQGRPQKISVAKGSWRRTFSISFKKTNRKVFKKQGIVLKVVQNTECQRFL